MPESVKINLIDNFRNHCNGDYEGKRKGPWLSDNSFHSSNDNWKEAVKRCIYTLNQLNKQGINNNDRPAILDLIYELNYRIIQEYLKRRILKSRLNDLQKINFYIQGIICGDVPDLEEHYKLQKDI